MVSIIIPAFNSEGSIAATLDSCLLQRSYLLEVIIVDDHSNDKSEQVVNDYVKRYPEYVKIVTNLKKGGNNARNYGFSLSKGRYIQWLDSDDLLQGGKLQAQVEFLEAHEEVDIVYSDWQLNTYDSNNQLYRSEVVRCFKHPDFLLELLKDNWSPPHSYLLRRPIAQKCIDENGWNPETQVGQDREFFTLCALLEARFGYLPGNYCIYNRSLAIRSVSRSLTPGERADRLMRLLKGFIEIIDSKSFISAKKRREYHRTLWTQIACYAATYNFSIGRNDLSVSDINWWEIKGIRSKLKVMKRIVFSG